MRGMTFWRQVWSEQPLFSNTVLWLLFWVNAGGTVYGYVWYWRQLVHTYETMDRWLLPFVPDSPTASLFFTLSLMFMIIDRSERRYVSLMKLSPLRFIRAIVDAFAVITLVKYGVWAVAIIFAQGYQGETIVWQQWMLVVSHTGMALQAVVYAKLMRFGKTAMALVAVWTLTNDYLDYHRGIYPWLPRVLKDDLAIIEASTVALSLFCILLAYALYLLTRMKSRLT